MDEITSVPVSFHLRRGKSGVRGTSIARLKSRLMKVTAGLCDQCGEDDPNSLQLDHVIPVALAGNVFDISNLRLLCHHCHAVKTAIDHKIIRSFKGLNFLSTEGFSAISFVPIERLHELYGEAFRSMKETILLRHKWDLGEVRTAYYSRNLQVQNKEDHKQVMGRENGVEEGRGR